MLVTPCGLTREWGSRSFPGPDNILTTPHPSPALAGTHEAYAGYAKPMRLHSRGAPYPNRRYRLSRVAAPADRRR